MATASASGIEWLTAKNSHSNGPSRSLRPLGDGQRVRLDPPLAQLGLDQREGELRADQRDVGLVAQQVRHRADVVLVRRG